MTSSIIYWISVLDVLKGVAFFLTNVSFGAAFFTFAAWINSNEPKPGCAFPVSIFFFLAFLCAFIFIPSKETSIAMHAIPIITDNPDFKALPADVAKMLRSLAQQYTAKDDAK